MLPDFRELVGDEVFPAKVVVVVVEWRGTWRGCLCGRGGGRGGEGRGGEGGGEGRGGEVR